MHGSHKEVLQYQRAHKHDTHGQLYWYYGHMWTLCGKH